MKKKFSYFFQSIVVYLFFLFSKIIGLKFSRLIFSYIFVKIGNFFKSKKVILENLKKIDPDLSSIEKEKIIKKMWSNYGKTFIEYAHLKKFKYKTEHI